MRYIIFLIFVVVLLYFLFDIFWKKLLCGMIIVNQDYTKRVNAEFAKLEIIYINRPFDHGYRIVAKNKFTREEIKMAQYSSEHLAEYELKRLEGERERKIGYFKFETEEQVRDRIGLGNMVIYGGRKMYE